MKRIFFALTMLLALTGHALAQSSAPPEVAVKDPITGCVVYMRLPPNLSNAQLGKVTGGFWNTPPVCINGLYQGELMYGWSATLTSKEGVASELQAIRNGYAVDGRITGLLLNMIYGMVVVADSGRMIKQFNKTDDGYNIQQVYDAFAQSLAERSANNPNFNLTAVNAILKVWDSNHNATVKYYATSQSDDLKVFGRSARGG